MKVLYLIISVLVICAGFILCASGNPLMGLMGILFFGVLRLVLWHILQHHGGISDREPSRTLENVFPGDDLNRERLQHTQDHQPQCDGGDGAELD